MHVPASTNPTRPSHAAFRCAETQELTTLNIRYSGVLCDRRMAGKLMGKVYKNVVRPALFYGAETWATTRGHETRLDANETRMVRWMSGVTRADMM